MATTAVNNRNFSGILIGLLFIVMVVEVKNAGRGRSMQKQIRFKVNTI
jgi:hypothetical protein